jgi:hypothetical protein
VVNSKIIKVTYYKDKQKKEGWFGQDMLGKSMIH